MIGRGGLRQSLAAAFLAATVAAVLFAWFHPAQGQAAAPLFDAAFCALAPTEARATPGDKADVTLAAVVPMETPAAGLEAATGAAAAKGDVVRVSVTSPRDGGVAVHGLLDVRPIAAGERVSFEFRAIYTGRFPIHFHGADGTHFEIAAIEVLPTRVSAR